MKNLQLTSLTKEELELVDGGNIAQFCDILMWSTALCGGLGPFVALGIYNGYHSV